MSRKLDLLLALFFLLLLCLQTIIAQELSNEEWDAQYIVWEQEIQSGKDSIQSNNYKGAKPHFDSAINIAKLIFDTDDEDLAETAFRLGDVQQNLRLFKDAENSFRIVLQYILSDLGKEDKSYGIVMSRLGHIYDELEDYNASFSCYNEAVDDAILHYGKEHEIYIRRLNGLALNYLTSDDYEHALPLFEEVVSKAEKIIDPNSSVLGTFYNNLALTYLNTKGQIKEAEKMLLKAIEISNTNQDIKSYSYIIRLTNLANVYFLTGKLQNSFNNLQKATLLAEAYLPKHPVRLKCYNNLSKLYFNLGNTKKGGEYYNKALKFIEENSLEYTLDHAMTIVNNSQFYRESGLIEDAIEGYEQALEIIKQKLGVNSEKYLNVLSSLSVTHYYNGNTKESINLSKKALEIVTYLKGESSNEYATHLTNFALALGKSGNLERSIELLNQSKDIIASIDGITSHEYTTILSNLSLSYLEKEDVKMAINLIEQANENYKIRIKDIFTFQGEKEKKELISTLSNNYAIHQSVLLDYGDNSSFLEMNLNNTLMLKNLVLKSSKDILKELKSLKNFEINKKIDSLRRFKSLINRQFALKRKERDAAFEDWQLNCEQVENDLIQIHSQQFNKGIDVPSWKVVQNQLHSNQIALEFSKFNYYHKNKFTDSTFYIAYVYKKDWKQPKLVKLFEEHELKKILKGASPNKLYETRGSKGKSVNTSSNSEALYNLIWKPISEYLEEIKTIYFAPDGMLHQLSFAAFSNSKGEQLCGNYNLVQLSNTTVLQELKSPPKLSNTVFIGGVNYEFNKDKTSSISQNKENLVFQNEANLRSNRSASESWNYLPETLSEIQFISGLLNSKTSIVLSGDDANEANFKKLGGNSPSILHIATHGFFYDKPPIEDRWKMERDAKEVVYKYAKDPLLRSGLILAGANYAWLHAKNPYEKEDGILTALEISNLDLSNTDIVILSACETGLGDIDGSEGVYGLQRAFKMAGVDLIMMSLWQVPDKETAEFMNLFYSNWLRGMKVREAFTKTQRTMSSKYKEQPEKWAAFVLFE